jgi:ABC-type nickel/cobalt efflux system permease component RcnA
MGIIYVGVGVVILLAKQFNFQSVFTVGILAKIFAVMVIIYGGWRIYRGLKKKYFKE